MKKGFTLAEVMITLTVIGIITAIILPVAFHSVPDENIMKFKKANNTLFQVIQTLINSEKYYKDGDLGTRADGVQLKPYRYTGDELVIDTCNNSEENSDVYDADSCDFTKYFCNTFAEVITAKKINCSTSNRLAEYGYVVVGSNGTVSSPENFTIGEQDWINAKLRLDTLCKQYAKTTGEEITAQDNVVYYQSQPGCTFGVQSSLNRHFSPPNGPVNIKDQNGFDIAYKVLCVDIDGIPEEGSENCDDVKDVCPFGYGVRADGKILAGARADEWLNKAIQKN